MVITVLIDFDSLIQARLLGCQGYNARPEWVVVTKWSDVMVLQFRFFGGCISPLFSFFDPVIRLLYVESFEELR